MMNLMKRGAVFQGRHGRGREAGDYTVGRFYSSQEGGFREDTTVPPLPNSTFHHGVVVTVEPQ